jgi:FkbM family methyltransferase
MNIPQKILFHLTKLLKMAWFNVRYRVNPFKKIENIVLPVKLKFGYNVLRFIDNGTYEKGEIDIIKSTLSVNDKVLELGTGLGFVSAYCASKIGNDRVITYEANLFMKPYIEKLYKKNKVAPDLRIALLGETSGNRIFYKNKNSFLASSLNNGPGGNLISFQVVQEDLNEIIRKENPSYFIMDIEGGEYDIFKIISFQSIKKIQFELHPLVIGKEGCEEIFRILKEQSFVKDDLLSKEDNYFYYLQID